MSNEQKHQAGAPKGAEAPKAAAKEIKLTPAKDLKQTVAELKKKLPLQFAQKCTQCGEAKKVRQDVFIARVEKVQGDVDTLMNHYTCAKCRKASNKDMIGRPRVAGGATKILTLEDVQT